MSSVGPLDGPIVDQNLNSSAQLNSTPLICRHQTTIIERHNNSSPRANRRQNSSPIVGRHQRQQNSSPLVGRVDWHYNNSSLTSELIQNSSSNPHITNSSSMVGRHLNQSSTVINGNGNQIEEETRFSNWAVFIVSLLFIGGRMEGEGWRIDEECWRIDEEGFEE